MSPSSPLGSAHAARFLAVACCLGGMVTSCASPPRPVHALAATPSSALAPATSRRAMVSEASEPGETASTTARSPRSGRAAETVELEVPGFGPALVRVPGGEDGPRPVIVATHGAWERPEVPCDWWGEFAGDRAFVVCPRGLPFGEGVPVEQQHYYYPSQPALEKEVLGSLEALRHRFGERVDPGPAIYAGFSQGAIMGALLVGQHPEVFSRAVLVEGGFNGWPSVSARKFASKGGKRVLFACGTDWCSGVAREASQELEHAGVSSRLVLGQGAGHTSGGVVGEKVRASFDWLVEGDDRWSAPSSSSSSSASRRAASR